MVSRRAFLNTTMKTLAAASAAGVMRPMFTMAQSPAGGILKNVVHVFLYGGLDGRWAYPYHEGPVQQVLAARRPNINQLPWAGNPITLDQHGRANPIGFQSSWQELLNAVQITNCGISLLTEYGITEGYSFSHEIAQNMFHNGNNIENYSTVPKGWLARLIDGYQLPQFTTWGFRVTEPTFFNSEFSTPLVISNVDDFKHERRHFGNLYCSTDTGNPEYMIGCPIGQSWQGRESTAEEDNILMRQVMKDIRSAPKRLSGDLVNRFTDTLDAVDASVGIMQGTIKPIRDGLPESDFKVTGSGGGLSSFQSAMRELAATAIYANTSAPQSLRESTKLFCTGIGGFDAHSNINWIYPNLITEVACGLKGLVKSLHNNSLLNDTAILVHSEFGRTTAQNGSAGTDHAGASHGLLIGGRVRRQAVGPDPSVNEANNQNHFTPQLPFSAVLRQLLAAAGFTGAQMSQIIPVLPGESNLNLFT